MQIHESYLRYKGFHDKVIFLRKLLMLQFSHMKYKQSNRFIKTKKSKHFVMHGFANQHDACTEDCFQQTIPFEILTQLFRNDRTEMSENPLLEER